MICPKQNLEKIPQKQDCIFESFSYICKLHQKRIFAYFGFWCIFAGAIYIYFILDN